MDLSLTVQSGPTPVGALLRSMQAYRELACQKTTLDGGIAFHCDRFPACATESEFREVWTPTAGDAKTALAAADAFFAERGLRCARWALAEAQAPEAVEPVLAAAGWVRDDRTALVLHEWAAPAKSDAVRVLPARPMRGAYRECWADWASYLPDDAGRAAAVDVVLERLDDHRVDAFVAMIDKQPAGAAAVFQVGDIGHVVDLYVCKAYRGRNIAAALFGHALTLLRRLALRIIVASWPQRDPAGVELIARHGFAVAGRVVEFRRGDDPLPDVVDGW